MVRLFETLMIVITALVLGLPETFAEYGGNDNTVHPRPTTVPPYVSDLVRSGRTYADANQETEFNDLVQRLDVDDQGYDHQIERLVTALMPDFENWAKSTLNIAYLSLHQKGSDGLYRYVAIAQKSGFCVPFGIWETIPHELRKYKTMANHALCWLSQAGSDERLWSLFRRACVGAADLGDAGVCNNYMQVTQKSPYEWPTHKRRRILLPLSQSLLEGPANATKEACLIEIYDLCEKLSDESEFSVSINEKAEVSRQERQSLERALKTYPQSQELKLRLIDIYHEAVVEESNATLCMKPTKKLLIRLEAYGWELDEEHRSSVLLKIANMWLQSPNEKKGLERFIDIHAQVFTYHPAAYDFPLFLIPEYLHKLYTLLAQESKDTADTVISTYVQRFVNTMSGQETEENRQRASMFQKFSDDLNNVASS